MSPVVRDARTQTIDHTGPTADRYHAAMVHYLAAIAEPSDGGEATHPSLLDEVRWKLPRVAVSDIMTTAVIAVTTDTPFRQIVGTLARNNVGAVPVIDDHDRVVGVVSQSDLMAKVAAGGERHPHLAGRRPDRRALLTKSRGDAAGELMTQPAITVAPNTSVIEAARTCARARIHHLPVVDHRGVLVGIIGRSDLLSLFLREDPELQAHLVSMLGTEFALNPDTVDVRVDNGVVTLRGQVERRLLLDPILHAVRSTTGVVATHNHLTYAIDDTVIPVPKPIV